MTCRVCGQALGAPLLHLPSPSVTSGGALLPAPTQVFGCGVCGHAQSPALPDSERFYASEYRISLQSEDHDQIYEVRDGVPVFRTDRQAQALCERVPLKAGARVLDFGAGKGETLRKFALRRPDIRPFVFDVSDDYRSAWRSWIPDERTASFSLDESWNGSFDLIVAHYVLEHVDDLSAALARLRRLLAREGRLYVVVPDWTANPGDLLVADHVNHFSKSSLAALLRRGGFAVTDLDDGVLPAALVAIAHAGEAEAPSQAAQLDPRLVREADFWMAVDRGVSTGCRRMGDRRIAIYGAGFYGAWLASRIAPLSRLACMVDANPHLQGRTLLGIPVLSPDEASRIDVDVAVVGLNPAHARATAARIPFLSRPGLVTMHLDEFASSGREDP